MKNRGLLRKYLVVLITAHTHVKRKSIEKTKIIEKTVKKEKGYNILIQDQPATSQ